MSQHITNLDEEYTDDDDRRIEISNAESDKRIKDCRSVEDLLEAAGYVASNLCFDIEDCLKTLEPWVSIASFEDIMNEDEEGKGNIQALKRHVNPDGTRGGWVPVDQDPDDKDKPCVSQEVYVGEDVIITGNTRIIGKWNIDGNRVFIKDCHLYGEGEITGTTSSPAVLIDVEIYFGSKVRIHGSTIYDATLGGDIEIYDDVVIYDCEVEGEGIKIWDGSFVFNSKIGSCTVIKGAALVVGTETFCSILDGAYVLNAHVPNETIKNAVRFSLSCDKIGLDIVDYFSKESKMLDYYLRVMRSEELRHCRSI